MIASPALAQTNPVAAACGLPASGRFVASQTYTLTDDCVLTGQLEVQRSGSEQVDITINGAGYEISVDSTVTAFVLFRIALSDTLTLNDVTLNGGGLSRSTMISSGTGSPITSTTLTANRVTFKNNGGGVAVSAGSNVRMTLNNVLFEGNRNNSFLASSNPAALMAVGGAAVTLNNVVIRDHRYGGGAIVSRGATNGGSVTATGCLTFSGNVPYNVSVSQMGQWTNNSTGRCGGAIGNGGTANLTQTILPCGAPAAGSTLDDSATYTLTSDCVVGNETAGLEWVLSDGVSVTIRGNGHRLLGGTGPGYLLIITAGNSVLTTENIALDRVRAIIVGTWNARNIEVVNAPDRVIWHAGTATFTNSLFQNNTTTRSNSASVLYAVNNYGAGVATFTDSEFRDNSGRLAVLNHFTGSITLTGCATFENNTPLNYTSGVVDNSTGACGDRPSRLTTVSGLVVSSHGPRHNTGDLGEATPNQEACFQALGAIGLICRENSNSHVIQVWGVTSDSQGYFILELAQSQIDAYDSSALVARSPDGRVAVRVTGSECIKRDEKTRPHVRGPECIAALLTGGDGAGLGLQRFIIVSMGPNYEGKVHNVLLDNSLAGRVVGTVDTYTGLPGGPATGAVGDKATNPVNADDRPLVHIVRAGETITEIAQVYGVAASRIIASNRLENDGHLIFPNQQLNIPATH